MSDMHWFAVVSTAAAAIAIDDRVPVQNVDYAKLRARLNAARVLVEWDASRTVKPIGGDSRPKVD